MTQGHFFHDNLLRNLSPCFSAFVQKMCKLFGWDSAWFLTTQNNTRLVINSDEYKIQHNKICIPVITVTLYQDETSLRKTKQEIKTKILTVTDTSPWLLDSVNTLILKDSNMASKLLLGRFHARRGILQTIKQCRLTHFQHCRQLNR